MSYSRVTDDDVTVTADEDDGGSESFDAVGADVADDTGMVVVGDEAASVLSELSADFVVGAVDVMKEVLVFCGKVVVAGKVFVDFGMMVVLEGGEDDVRCIMVVVDGVFVVVRVIIVVLCKGGVI